MSESFIQEQVRGLAMEGYGVYRMPMKRINGLGQVEDNYKPPDIPSALTWMEGLLRSRPESEWLGAQQADWTFIGVTTPSNLNLVIRAIVTPTEAKPPRASVELWEMDANRPSMIASYDGGVNGLPSAWAMATTLLKSRDVCLSTAKKLENLGMTDLIDSLKSFGRQAGIPGGDVMSFRTAGKLRELGYTDLSRRAEDLALIQTQDAIQPLTIGTLEEFILHYTTYADPETINAHPRRSEVARQLIQESRLKGYPADYYWYELAGELQTEGPA